jgi:hypothetical protein
MSAPLAMMRQLGRPIKRMLRTAFRPIKLWLLPPCNETLIFVHIPKAAGTTLSRIIGQVYRPAAVYSINAGLTEPGELEALARLPAAERRRIQVLQGHFIFGVHAYLPQPARYITLLRDPVERIVSNYCYILQTPEHFRHEDVVRGKMDVVDYAESEKLYLNNGQIQVLAGLGPGAPATRDALRQARCNIEGHFAVVGLAERFDDSLALIRHCFGWPTRSYRSMNVSGRQPSQRVLTPQALAHLRALNALDQELYAWSAERFEAQHAAARRHAA